MPIRSKPQFRLMQAAKNAPTAKGLSGVPRDVAKEFIRKTPKEKQSLFARGKR